LVEKEIQVVLGLVELVEQGELETQEQEQIIII